MTYNSIVNTYGDKGITCFDLANGIAEFSDDTQMTLFTANGLLNGITRNAHFRKDTALIDYVDSAYMDWYKTQLRQGCMILEHERNCWLDNVPGLYSLRSPGNTCLSAIEQRRCGMKVDNNSKECGGIMRVAPVAFAFGKTEPSDSREEFKNRSEVIRMACEVARLTHLHPLGFLPAGVMVHLLYKIAFLDNLTDPATGASYKSLYHEVMDELNIMILKTFRLASVITDDVSAIRQLGQGWTGDEALYIALYCAIRHLDNMRDAIIASVNHDGDSDSTGSVCGNIMGAIHGYEAIKRQRLFCPQGKEIEQTLELSNIILAIADDLYTGCIIDEYNPIDTPEKKQCYERYCKMEPVGI